MQTVFESEIIAQSDVLNARRVEGQKAALAAAQLFNSSVTHLVVAARGSSDNAAVYLQYLAGREVGLLVALATPSLYAKPAQVNLAGSIVLGISQSGRSPDIVSVLHAARTQGRPTIAITNDIDSPLAREALVVIPLLVGDEISLAATKTMLASLHSVAQLVQALASPKEALAELDVLPSMIKTTSEWAINNVGDALSTLAFGGLTVVGRGVGLSSAEECALKIREVAGIRAEAYAAPDILHGPISAEGTGSSLWLQLTDEIDDENANNLITRARQSGLATLVTRTPSRGKTSADTEIVLPIDSPNWITPFLHIVIGQVMALRLGEQRHRPIDQPPGLQKITLTH